MAGTWVWANGDAVSYSQAFVDGDPVQMSMANVVGTWTPDFYDVSYLTKGFVCSTPMSQLVCPSQSVAYAVASTAGPVRSSENVTYTCPAGYQMYSGVVALTATCLSSKTWDVTVPNCTRITCSWFPVPSGMTRNSEAFAVGTNVTYTCASSRAYFAPGPPTSGRTWKISCQSDGIWTSSPPSCYAYTCNMPPMVQYSTLSSTDIYSGATLTYTCLNGYELPESSGSTSVTTKAILCNANQTAGFWSVTAGAAVPSSCNQITCAPLVLPAFSTSDTSSLVALTVMNVWCNVGYNFADVSATTIVQQTTCQNSRYWSKIFTFGCQIRTCPALTVNNATLVGSAASSYPYNTTLTFKCVGALLFPGGNDTFVTTCTDTGNFLPSPPLSGCQEGTCQSSWSPYGRHCYFVSDSQRGLLRLSSAEMSCKLKAGHVVDIQSQEENDFVANLAGLLDFLLPPGGWSYWTGWTFVNGIWQWSALGQVGNYTNWMLGYPEYPADYWCSSISLGGQWKDKPCAEMLPYICKKPAVCGLPPKIANGVLTTSPAPTYGEIGQTISYTCNQGFAFASIGALNMAVTCLSGGYWSSIESCTTARCSRVTRVVSATLSTTSNVVGTTVTYACNPGFWFSNRALSVTAYCNSTLQWSQVVPSMCYAICCPQNTTNATAYYGNNTLIGAMDRFTCLKGYIYPDGTLTKQLSCSSLGVWSPTTNSTCLPVICPPYVNANAILSITGPASYGQVVQVTCLTGYYMSDLLGSTASANCTEYATWSQILPRCQRKPCAPVPDVEMANCTLINDTVPLAFSSVNCSCINSTMYINGDTWRTTSCHPISLTWLQVPGRCVDVAVYLQSLNRTVVNAPNAVAFGSVGLVIVSVVVVAVFCVDALTLKMHFRSR